MQEHKHKTAVMLCAAAALAAAVVPASASARAPSPPHVVAVDCFSKSQVRPGDFLLACGDGNNRLTALRWSSWGPKSAVGSGLDVVNDCQPYCAAGKFHSYRVTVRLDRPETWQKHPELQHFTRMRLIYTDNRPARVQQEVTYKLWD
ncbi:hypothetical protein OIE54_39855 [Streptomyces sp. NBC_01794]|nr:hypothetical protein OIE54_39855 [Streptomyces sp. NBC_01794]WSD30867.1 hypothetical protein OG966_02250 [Streptomyces sp. NBC_01750]